MTAEDFVTADDAVITTSSTLTDGEIQQEDIETENDEVEEIEDDDEKLVAPSTRDVENLLELLKNFSLFREKRGDQMQDLIDKFETLLLNVQASKNYDLFCKKKLNLDCHTLTFFMFISSFTQTCFGLLEAFS